MSKYSKKELTYADWILKGCPPKPPKEPTHEEIKEMEKKAHFAWLRREGVKMGALKMVKVKNLEGVYNLYWSDGRLFTGFGAIEYL